jgi:hypothetical protein
LQFIAEDPQKGALRIGGHFGPHAIYDQIHAFILMKIYWRRGVFTVYKKEDGSTVKML